MRLLSWIHGYKIPFAKPVYQKSAPCQRSWSSGEKTQITSQLVQLMDKGAITLCTPTEGQFISGIFLVPKPDGSSRLILNLKELNKFIITEHFKLENLKTAMRMMSPGIFMAKIDLKDAYYVISIDISCRKYLRFQFEDRLYEFKCLPFGLSTAPFVFTKIMKPVVAHLRNKRFLSIVYLDDFLLMGDTEIECLHNIKSTCELLSNLGFVINFNKSDLIPNTCCRFLGFNLNSQNMTVELPDEKRVSLISQVRKFKLINVCRIRSFAELIGKLVSACNAVKYGLAHTKIFEREKYLALQSNNGNFDRSMKLQISELLKEDLTWWESKLSHFTCPIRQFKFELEIFSDASNSGWGVFCKGKRAHGSWNAHEKKSSINFRELLSAFFGIKCFTENLINCEILLRIDNTTAIAYINRMGGIQYPHLNNLTREIWDWAETRNLWFFASYISSGDNKEADFESRRLEPETEYSLSGNYFKLILDAFGKPSIDLFASRLNNKCVNYVSWIKDPGAIAVDAFTIAWEDYFYAFPPFSIILRVLKKIKSEKAEGILVVPNWPTQPWYPRFNSMLIEEPIVFKPDINMLHSSDSRPHPLWQQITLVVGKLSGEPLQGKEPLRRQ